MNVFFRIAAIELARLLSLSSAAVSAFVFSFLSILLILMPIQIYYGSLQITDLQLVLMTLPCAFGPAVMVAYAPGIGAGSFDIELGTRRLSRRELDIIGKVQEQLKACAAKSAVKLPQIVWRVKDTGEINAFAYAHNRVCFTKGILHKYGDTREGIERLAGVAAHEIGHLRNWDTRISMFLRYLSMPVKFGIGLNNNTICKIPFVGFVFSIVTTLMRVPCDISQFLNDSTSQFQELQADRFAGKLMNGVGISGFLDDLTHVEERQGDTFSAWLQRSHPPSELRHDELARGAG